MTTKRPIPKKILKAVETTTDFLPMSKSQGFPSRFSVKKLLSFLVIPAIASATLAASVPSSYLLRLETVKLGTLRLTNISSQPIYVKSFVLHNHHLRQKLCPPQPQSQRTRYANRRTSKNLSAHRCNDRSRAKCIRIN